MNETNTKPLKIVSLGMLIGEGWRNWNKLFWPRGFLMLTFGLVIPHLLFVYGIRQAAFSKVADIHFWLQGELGSYDPFVLAQIIMGFTSHWFLFFCMLVAIVYWSLLGYQKILANPRLGLIPAYQQTAKPTLIRDFVALFVLSVLAMLGSWMIIPMLIFFSAALLVPVVASARPRLGLKKMFSYSLGLKFRSRELSYLGALFSLLSLTCCFYLAQTLVDGISAHFIHVLSLHMDVANCSGQLLTWCAWGQNLVYILGVYLSYLILLILQGSLRFFYYSSK